MVFIFRRLRAATQSEAAQGCERAVVACARFDLEGSRSARTACNGGRRSRGHVRGRGRARIFECTKPAGRYAVSISKI